MYILIIYTYQKNTIGKIKKIKKIKNPYLKTLRSIGLGFFIISESKVICLLREEYVITIN